MPRSTAFNMSYKVSAAADTASAYEGASQARATRGRIASAYGPVTDTTEDSGTKAVETVMINVRCLKDVDLTTLRSDMFDGLSM